MMKVGLTGSIASGKSEVTKIFRKHGIPVFDADEAVHQIYADVELARDLAAAFPAAQVNGRIDRGRLSAHLLAKPEDFAKLEQIVHPLVRKRRADFIAENAASAVIVFDIPLLFETAEDKQMDCCVVVAAPAAVQRQRAMARPGMTAEKLARILARQMATEEKIKRADFVIANEGSLADLEAAVNQLIPQLRERAREF